MELLSSLDDELIAQLDSGQLSLRSVEMIAKETAERVHEIILRSRDLNVQKVAEIAYGMYPNIS